jgi:hypothetical protein
MLWTWFQIRLDYLPLRYRKRADERKRLTSDAVYSFPESYFGVDDIAYILVEYQQPPYLRGILGVIFSKSQGSCRQL